MSGGRNLHKRNLHKQHKLARQLPTTDIQAKKKIKRTGAKALARRRTLVELSRVNQRKCAHRRTAHGTATPAATTARSRSRVCGSRGAPPPAGAAKSVRPCEGTGKGRPRGPASACGFCGLCGAGCAMPGEAQRRYTRRARVRCACVIRACAGSCAIRCMQGTRVL